MLVVRGAGALALCLSTVAALCALVQQLCRKESKGHENKDSAAATATATNSRSGNNHRKLYPRQATATQVWWEAAAWVWHKSAVVPGNPGGVWPAAVRRGAAPERVSVGAAALVPLLPHHQVASTKGLSSHVLRVCLLLVLCEHTFGGLARSRHTTPHSSASRLCLVLKETPQHDSNWSARWTASTSSASFSSKSRGSST